MREFSGLVVIRSWYSSQGPTNSVCIIKKNTWIAKEITLSVLEALCTHLGKTVLQSSCTIVLRAKSRTEPNGVCKSQPAVYLCNVCLKTQNPTSPFAIYISLTDDKGGHVLSPVYYLLVRNQENKRRTGKKYKKHCLFFLSCCLFMCVALVVVVLMQFWQADWSEQELSI